jgi:hypothetical protein
MILPKFQVGNGIAPPPPPIQDPLHEQFILHTILSRYKRANPASYKEA